MLWISLNWLAFLYITGIYKTTRFCCSLQLKWPAMLLFLFSSQYPRKSARFWISIYTTTIRNLCANAVVITESCIFDFYTSMYSASVHKLKTLSNSFSQTLQTFCQQHCCRLVAKRGDQVLGRQELFTQLYCTCYKNIIRSLWNNKQRNSGRNKTNLRIQPSPDCPLITCCRYPNNAT